MVALRLTPAEYEAIKNREPKRMGQAPFTPGQSKFRSVMCEADGIKFRSKKERKRYLELMALKHAGEVKYFLTQVPFRLPGNTKYLLDFMVFWEDGDITHEDAKGMKTPMFVMKKKQVEALYPIKITEPFDVIPHTAAPGAKRRTAPEEI